jgi:hypothetical protein
MSKRNHTEAQMIGALKQLEVCSLLPPADISAVCRYIGADSGGTRVS